MMPSKKKIKKILIILALLFVNAWFWGNAALQVYISRFDVISTELNRIPEKLVLQESVNKGEYLYFYDYGVKMPFLKKASEKDIAVRHNLLERYLFAISIDEKANDKDENITVKLIKSPQWDFEEGKSLFDRISDWLFENTYAENDSHWKICYAKLDDVSWWNTLENIGIAYLLSMKMIIVPRGDFRIYEVEMPYVNGILIESTTHDSFQFIINDELGFIGTFGDSRHKLRDIIRTISSIEDVDKAYKKMEALYENNLGYPEDLLILSMISLKGPQENYQREYLTEGLKEHLEWYEETYADKEDKEDYEESIAEIQGDIEYFEKSIE
jgi:hypothetical protein